MSPMQDPTTSPARAEPWLLRRMSAVTAADGGRGGPPLDPETRLSQCFAHLVDSGDSVAGFVVRHPRSAAGMLLDIRALPRLDAALPPGPESIAVQAQMMRHRTSRRFMSGVSAVLQVPAVPGTYLEGHERATVRRKARAARKKGVTVRSVDPVERPGLLRRADAHEQQNERAEYRVREPQNHDLIDYGLWMAAYDADDRAIALAVTPIAGEWATLRYFRTLHAGDASSDARYLLTEGVAEELGARGVRHLIDTARPHWLPNGLRHFQRMVGFRLVRVGPARVTD